MTPLVVKFRVNASCEHVFDMWANRPALWWPRSHTVTGAPDVDIVFEGRAGGRIFERSGDGTEHAWGEVTEWDPPNRVAYRWHLFFDPAEATDVEVTFSPRGSGTDVRIEQRGWERLGDAGRLRRTNTDRAWGAIVPVFIASCQDAPAVDGEPPRT